LLSSDDQRIYRAAFAAAGASDWVSARQIADRAYDRLLGDVLHWLELTRSNTAAFADIVEFAERHRDWPRQNILRERAEQLSGDIPDAVLMAYFQKNPPTTLFGKLHLAEIAARSGQGEAALAVVHEAWLSADLDADTEQVILDRFGSALRPGDHIARLDRLIWDGLTSAARRQLERVPEDQRILAEARLALAGAQPSVEGFVSCIPEYLRSDPGLLFDQARWSRRRNLLETAAAILMNPPQELDRPEAWQREREILARRLIDGGKDRLAYDLLTRHGLPEANAKYADAEFLSGWIALRRLGEPTAAYQHFIKVYAAAKLPIGRSRGAYWAGRAADVLGMEDASRGWFAAAAEHPATYYGQWAAKQLGIGVEPTVPRDPRPRAAEIAAFEADVLVRIVRMLSEIGESRIAKPFLFCLIARGRTPGERKLVATLAEKTRHLDVAVVAAKRASPGDIPLVAYGFPVISIDKAGSAETSLVLAVLRQESAFNQTAVSRADARGLMQLLPSTARQLAIALSMPFSADRLLTDATYNVTLGHAYLDKMLDTFNGSYLLSIAAYNAGPANVVRWLKAHGDPNGGSVADVVDWVELIPFDETRDYVQRVLENLQIYRLRLGRMDRAFKLAQDLQH
jgi:peptidoglycan lytic transglycosylase